MKAVSLEDVLAAEAPELRERVKVRAAQLVAEEMTLREFRKRLALTQVQVADELGIGQDSMSRIERRDDMLISTLRRTLEAMGGSLSLVATLPDHGRVELTGLGEFCVGD
ncbi:MAG: helix-turn-helix transcriptional regulator [Rhodobacteraceae bacterium]|nr:helix-turn-helix transcriptional regulator [Paracoccaceae bacterium]MCY4136760.1 helix-turn-helix transcriptional regulator [Paracoccaceae bacterium]